MAETKAVIFSDGKFQAINNSGTVVPYGKLYFTDADSGVEITTYTTSTMETENTYPIILSASGKADVYIGDGKYNVTLQDKNSTTVWTINNYIPAGGQIQLDPVTSTGTVEERTGETGTTIVLENTPTTDIAIHKNGLLLLTTDYTVEGKIVVFDDALVAEDVLIIKYGQLTEGQLIQSEWILQDLIYTYVSSNTFKTNGDTTSVFLEDRRVKIDLLASTSYASVVSATFSAGETTVVVDTTAMDNTLVSVSYGIVSPYLGASGGSLTFYLRSQTDALLAEKASINIGLSVVHNITVDADYTLTAAQNLYGRIEITDTLAFLSGATNIITDNIEHTFLAVNSSLQTLTFKTSAGTGIAVLAGEATQIRNDTVNVIEYEGSPDISSTAQAQAGTDNTTAISPLRMREGFNAAGSAPVYATRTWVDFDGSGTVTINGSGNISSVTDNGAGDYTPNIAVNIDDTDYAVTVGGVRAIGTPSGWTSVHTKAVGSFNIITTDAGGTFTDWDNVSAILVR